MVLGEEHTALGLVDVGTVSLSHIVDRARASHTEGSKRLRLP